MPHGCVVGVVHDDMPRRVEPGNRSTVRDVGIECSKMRACLNKFRDRLIGSAPAPKAANS